MGYTQNEEANPLPLRAPINPDFTLNMMNQKNTFGVVAPPANGFFGNNINKSAQSTNTFACVYDMRTNNRMTSVKSQTGNGCWDFASMGSVESRWKTSGLGTFDLGEHNLQQCHRFDPSRSTWGNHFMSSAYYIRRSGPISQSDDVLLSCPSYATPVAYITDVRYLPNNRDIIKQALLDYGGIYTMMYWDATKYNATNKTYFYNGVPRVNHAVVIAGWNDTMTTAGGNGAWIIKNSWGTSWGENGYFYISYGDSSILDYNAVWPSRIDYQPLSQVYNYDTLGYIEEWGYNDANADYGLVKFVASANHKITKVGSYVVGANSTLKFQVYKNFDTSTLSLSNLLNETPVKSCQFPGYYTYDLDSAIYLNKNDTFYIKVNYDVPGYGFPIPIEDTLWYYEGIWKHDYSNPSIETDKCWISGTGSNGSWWLLGASNPGYAVDLCIKAYAESMCTPQILPINENFQSSAQPDCWDQQNKSAFGTWQISTTTYAGGNANELIHWKNNTNTTISSISRMILPAINTTGISNLKLSFKNMYKDHQGWGGNGAVIKVQSSSDGINWTNENFSHTSGSGDMNAKDTTISILNNLNIPKTYLSFTLEGNLYHIWYWAIDNINIYEPNKQANIKTYPEGLYNHTSNQLNKVQDEFGNHFAGDTADLITVKLASKQQPYTIEYTYQTAIDTSGHIIFEILPDVSDSAYIVIRHGNHLETWSSSPISFASDTITYNFTTSSSKAYGDNQKEISPGIFANMVGDVNQDGIVDLSDLVNMDTDLTNGTVAYIVYDLNGDGVVDLSDLVTIDENIINGAVVMSP
jgi:C1A family cysteine protease